MSTAWQGPSGMLRRPSRHCFVAIAMCLLATAPLSHGQDDRYQFRVDDQSAFVGSTIEFPIYLDAVTGTLGAPLPVDGWEYGICDVVLHGQPGLQFIGIAEGAATRTINNGLPAHFRSAEVFHGAARVTTLIDFSNTHSLPAGTDHEIDRITCRVGSQFGVAGLDFCTTSQNDDVEVWINTASVAAARNGALVTLKPLSDDRYHLTVEGGSYNPGSMFATRVTMDAIPGTLGPPQNILGWALGVCHDPVALDFVDVTTSDLVATANNGQLPAYYALDVSEQHGPGFTVSTVIDLFGVLVLPAGEDLELLAATYMVLAPASSTTLLNFCDTIGPHHAIPPVVLPSFEPAVAPVLHQGLIQVLPPFRNGDCNSSGATNLADAVLLLTHLFPQASNNPPPCNRACDANQDGTLNIADAALLLLAALFGTPAAPIPGPACAHDTTTSPLSCAQSSCP